MLYMPLADSLNYFVSPVPRNDNASREYVTNHMSEDTCLQSALFWYIMCLVVSVSVITSFL